MGAAFTVLTFGVLLCISAYLSAIPTKGYPWPQRVAYWLLLMFLLSIGSLLFSMLLAPPTQGTDTPLLIVGALALIFWVPSAYVWARLAAKSPHWPKVAHWMSKPRVSKAATPPVRSEVALAAPVVSLGGLSAEDATRMRRLCEAHGLSAVDGPHVASVVAIVGDGSAADFDALGIPSVRPILAADAMKLVADSIAKHGKVATVNNLRMAVSCAQDVQPAQSAFLTMPFQADAPPDEAVEPIPMVPPPVRRRVESASPAGITSPLTLMFEYEDRDGNPSLRTVDVQAIGEANGQTYLDGICRDAQDERSFRTDRIVGALVDVDTGERFSITQVLAALPRRQASYERRGFAPRISGEREWQTAVLFTGFTRDRREELEGMAADAGWDVRSKVGPTLDYLVCGPKLSPTKQREADEHLVQVIDAETFEALIA